MNKFDENLISKMNYVCDNIPSQLRNGNAPREIVKFMFSMLICSGIHHELEFNGLVYIFEKSQCVRIKRNFWYYVKMMMWVLS